MPIGADWTVDYTYKRVTHTGGTDVYQMYELYAWLMGEFDESATIDDSIPMTAQTPTAFTLTNGWFIDDTSIQYLKGGSLKTIGWNGIVYADGIRRLQFNSGGYTSAITTDVGKVVTDGTDTGRLLAYDNTARVWWVRQDSTDDNFPASGSVTISSGTGAGTLTNEGQTGEQVWANIFTLGTLANYTQVYVAQDDVVLTPWWGVGQIDILVAVQQSGSLVDDGELTIFARRSTTLYDHYLGDFSDGARTPVPLAAFADSNNTSGYRQMVLTTASGNFTVGELIQDDSDTTIQGIVRSSSGTVPNITLKYVLVGALNDFGSGTGTFTGASSGATATAVASTDVGPALVTGVTFTFGATSQDLNNGEGSRPYDVIVDTNNYPLAQVYEYFKYVTRQGSSTTLNGYNGEQYTAVGEIRLPYDGQSTSFVEGETVNGQTSGATAVVVADHDAGATGALILKELTGVFVDDENIRSGVTVRAVANIPTGAEDIVPVKQSPFGTFAGGVLFAARGVWLANVYAPDANNYQLIDSEGVIQSPPQTIAITVTNTVSGDRVAVFPTTGNNEIIDKSQYTSHGSNNTLGAGTFEVQETIEADTPTSGYVRVKTRTPAGLPTQEDRYQYDSWTGSVFTLNVSNTLTKTYDGNDTAYVPYVDIEATGTSVSQSLIYSLDRYVLTVVRSAGMVPFKIAGQITTGGLTVTVIRNDDAIYQ